MANLFSGLFNNYSDVSKEELQAKYGMYLMADERVEMGFKLVRDTFIITNERLIFIDHQGVTGSKTHVKSIPLESIYEVDLETAGTGFDDSQLDIHYIKSPYFKTNNLQVASHRFEFGKKFNIQPLYAALMTLAHQNHKRLNS